MTDDDLHDLRPALADIARDLGALPAPERVQLLVELGDDLPELPQRLRDHPELLEAVRECQAPVFVRAEVAGTGTDAPVTIHVSAAPQAPVTRGFAGIVTAGLAGATAGEVLAVPADLPSRLALADVVSPLRLQGMAGLLTRVRRQVAEAAGLHRPADGTDG
ncbi:SufE family protein [Georgenia sp. Z1491]|uniref:SufE family protein n=1 Tax=Georgenia sp. Z1491 TaxID=3416707 RepID=UPI003CF15418